MEIPLYFGKRNSQYREIFFHSCTRRRKLQYMGLWNVENYTQQLFGRAEASASQLIVIIIVIITTLEGVVSFGIQNWDSSFISCEKMGRKLEGQKWEKLMGQHKDSLLRERSMEEESQSLPQADWCTVSHPVRAALEKHPWSFIDGDDGPLVSLGWLSGLCSLSRASMRNREDLDPVSALLSGSSDTSVLSALFWSQI